MMDKRKLKDAKARELIETNLDQSMLVEAAAGTGKTTLLIQRILNLIIEKNVSLTRVVAITFTEKAAGELKQRLRSKLEDSIELDRAGMQAARFRQALAELDLMPVKTIHGFCFDLIRQLPIEAEIDPDLQLFDEAGETASKDEFWETWLTQQLSADCAALRPLFEMDLAIASEMRGLTLRNLFDELTANQDTLEKLYIARASLAEINDRISELTKTISASDNYLSSCQRADDRLFLAAKSLDEWQQVSHAADLQSILLWLRDFKIFGTSLLGNKRNWISAEDLNAAREWLSQVMDQIAILRAIMFSHYASAMIDWLKQAANEYSEWKRLQGYASFQDLLIIARDLLHNSEPARRFFKKCYDYLLIDEFQDTDPLQTEIIFYLAEQQNEFAADWRAVNIEQGKLFIVGDPKQSIYRFRRADLELYKEVKSKFEREGLIVIINVSFRSVQPIISEVNDLFAPQMTGGTDDHYEPDYVPMEPHRSFRGNETAIELLSPPANWNSGEHSSTRTAKEEAAAIAEHMLHLMASGTQVGDADKQRALQWGDIAVLTRTWTNTHLLEQEFRAREIPFELPTDRVFGERAEILAMKTMLSALDNPYDEECIVGALRSSLLACTDTELLLHRARGGTFNYRNDSIAAGHLGRCFAILKELYAKKQSLTVSELIDEIITVTHTAELLALKPQGQNRIDTLNKLASYIRSLEATGAKSLHAIVRLLNQEVFLKTIGEAESGDAVVDRVSILSFFKAKGLEFPVVILYDLSHKANESTNIIYNRNQGNFEFAMSAELCTTGFADAKDTEHVRQQQEGLRLLYVAMTRARDKLVLPLYWFSKRRTKPASFQCFFESYYPPQADGKPLSPNNLTSCIDIGSYDLNKRPREQLRIDLMKPFTQEAVAQAETSFAHWRQFHESATAKLVRHEQFGSASKQKPVATSIEHDENIMRGAEFGSFVHEILERIELPDGKDLKFIAMDLKNQHNLTGEDAQLAESLILEMLKSPLFSERLAHADMLFRELPFSVMLDNVLYEGRMDLVFMENAQPVIVDFKTNVGSSEDLIEKYKPQAEIYARALEHIIGCEVREVILYHVRQNRALIVTRPAAI